MGDLITVIANEPQWTQWGLVGDVPQEGFTRPVRIDSVFNYGNGSGDNSLQ